MGRQPRQRPVSCHFCRVRKLRCSRVFPCSNCTSRGLSCPEPLDPPPAPSQSAGVPASVSAAVVDKRTLSGGGGGDASDTDILARLERLEALLAVRTRELDAVGEKKNHSGGSVESSPAGLASQLPLPQPMSPKVQNLTQEAMFLERNCLGPKLEESLLGDDIVFRVCPIRFITKSSTSYVFQNAALPSSSLSFAPTRCIWLPQRDEMRILVDHYLSNITYIRHIVHSPTLRLMVDDVYDALQQGRHVLPGAVTLLLALAADVTYSWTPADDDEECGLFVDADEANAQSVFFLKSGLDLLDNAQRNAHVSIECIQGILLLTFVICNLEGISIRARSAVSKATIMARELGLHRIDHPSNSAVGHTSGWSELQLEVGRRVWWYLMSTDWLMARFPGPHEGTYTIHPQHMAVRKPLNIEDEALSSGRKPVGLPLEQPTCMSYFLQRVRLAELSRTFMDRMSLANTDFCAIGYDTVTDLDRAIDAFIRDVPSFFTMEASQLRELPASDPRRSPAIIVQRHVLNLFVHGQRCKLHLPYLVRGTVDPAYAHSRAVCLETAKIIVDMEHRLEREGIPFVKTRLRLAVALHSVFLAGIALLIDLCLVPEDARDDKTTTRELMAQVWRILDDAHRHSVPAAKLQDLLRQVMKKHKVQPPGSKPRESEMAVALGGDGSNGPMPLTPASGENPEHSLGGTPLNEALGFPDLDSLDGRMDLDGIDWDSLLWGLDAPGPFM